MSDQPMPTPSGTDNVPALPILALSRLPILTPDRFTAEQHRAVEQIIAATKLSDTASIMTCGAAPQQSLSRHLTELISDSTIGQAGVAARSRWRSRARPSA